MIYFVLFIFNASALPGEGTGLGLDIVRKIAEKHGGKISFTSKAGETCFTVEFPTGK